MSPHEGPADQVNTAHQSEAGLVRPLVYNFRENLVKSQELSRCQLATWKDLSDPGSVLPGILSLETSNEAPSWPKAAYNHLGREKRHPQQARSRAKRVHNSRAKKLANLVAKNAANSI